MVVRSWTWAFLIRHHWCKIQFIKCGNLESLIQVLAFLLKQRFISVPLSELLPICYRMHVLAEAESCAKELLHEVGDCWDIWGWGVGEGAVKYFYYKVNDFSPFYMLYLWSSIPTEHLRHWGFFKPLSILSFIALLYMTMPIMRWYKQKWGMKKLNPVELSPTLYFAVDSITTQKQVGASFNVLFQIFGKCSKRRMVSNVLQIADIIALSCCHVLLNEVHQGFELVPEN